MHLRLVLCLLPGQSKLTIEIRFTIRSAPITPSGSLNRSISRPEENRALAINAEAVRDRRSLRLRQITVLSLKGSIEGRIRDCGIAGFARSGTR